MGLIIPSIPYKSQYDDDASDFRNDCGPACVAMVLNGLGINASTNTVYRKTGAKANGFVSVSQMMRSALTFGVDFDYFYPWTIYQLKNNLRKGRPAIALVNYSMWVKLGRTQSRFPGPHFVLVVGFDRENIVINDPLWGGTRREEGEHIRWNLEEFASAWGNAHKDGNRDFSGIFCRKRLPVEKYGWELDPGPDPDPEEEELPPVPPPNYEVDPALRRRIEAWACFHNRPIPELKSQAEITSYKDALGDWGLRIETHTIMESDTLPILSLKYYNDPEKWRVLVYFNGMSFSDTIHDGDVMLIPEPLEETIIIEEEEIPDGGTPLHDKAMYELDDLPERGRKYLPK